MPDNDPDPTMKLPDPGTTPEAMPSAGELLARALGDPGNTGSAHGWTPPTPEELSALLPQYRIEALIGHGGMGAVYKGVQAALKRPVAIKLLPLEISADPAFARRFEHEAQTLARLSHPNIVSVYDFGTTAEGHLYFVMEFVEGTDLHKMIHGPGLLPAQTLGIIIAVCEALQYAHGKGVVHRDIKPANVMVNTEGTVKVADFGLARLSTPDTDSGGLTMTGTVMGTPAYMAPEQTRGMNVDHRADIYSLGVMLYEMLCGEIPRGVFDPPSHKVQVDVRLDEVVLKAMHSAPERRYQNTVEMKTDVDRIRTTPPKMRPAPKTKSKSRLAAIVAAAVAILGLVAWAAFGKKGPQLTEAGRAEKARELALSKATPPAADSARLWVDVTGKATTLNAMTALGTKDFRNGAIRARFKGAQGIQLFLREQQHIGYRLILNNSGANVHLFDSTQNKAENLAHFAVPPLGDTNEHEVNFSGRDNELTVWLDGAKLGVADGSALREGNVQYYLPRGTTLLRLEYSNLDTSAAEPWQDVLHDPARLGLSGGAERTPEGLRFTGSSGVGFRLAQSLGSNAAVRVRATFGGSRVELRARKTKTFGSYALVVSSEKTVILSRLHQDSSQNKLIGNFQLPEILQPGQDYELELRAVGQTFTAKFNGKVLGVVTDETYSEGEFGIGSVDRDRGPTVIKSLEILNLDAPGKVSPSPAPQVSKSSPTPAAALLSSSTEPWKDVLRDPTKLALEGAVERTPEGLRFTAGGSSALLAPNQGPRRDGAVRLRTTFGGLRPTLHVRGSQVVTGYFLYTVSDGKAVKLVVANAGAGVQWTNLPEFPLREPLQPGQEYELELRVVGQTLTVKFNGEVLGTVTDGTFSEGRFGVQVTDPKNTPALVKAIEVLDLDAPGKASPSPGGAAPDPASVQTFGGHRYQLVRGRMTWETAKARAEQMGGHLATVTNKEEDEFIRRMADAEIPTALQYVWLGASSTTREPRFVWVTAEPFDYTAWSRLPVPHSAPEELPTALRLWRSPPNEGSILGWMELTRSRQESGPDLLTNVGFLVEWDDAGGNATPSKTTPSAATKDAPFVNTLGMKFVPVPIGGGPTQGQRVLFGVWDVRVQDYATYVAANPKVDGAWKTQNKDGVAAAREPDHPVAGVSWEDAQGFCQWLTAKENAEGKLPKGLGYRLPSDEEWSWAVGLPPEVGNTPEEKHGKNRVDFPWGKDYPPTKKVGNYADETFHAKFPVKRNEKENRDENPWMKNYTDGYATTSPVGSFPANEYGLYDMGGNVWQWCEDSWNAEHTSRVQRGASWYVFDRGTLRSSHRDHGAPTARFNGFGFRCVMGMSAP